MSQSATYGYAWIIKAKDSPDSHWELCRWVEPSPRQLDVRSKPSPEARMVRVQIIPTNKTNRRLLKPSKKMQERWAALQHSMAQKRP